MEATTHSLLLQCADCCRLPRYPLSGTSHWCILTPSPKRSKRRVPPFFAVVLFGTNTASPPPPPPAIPVRHCVRLATCVLSSTVFPLCRWSQLTGEGGRGRKRKEPIGMTAENNLGIYYYIPFTRHGISSLSKVHVKKSTSETVRWSVDRYC